MHIEEFPRALQQLILSVKPRESNDPVLTKLAADFFVLQTLTDAGKDLDKVKKEVKNVFPQETGVFTDETDLFVTTDVTVTIKVQDGRQTFNKDEFIRLVAQKYEIPAQALNQLASEAVNKTAPIVFLKSKANRLPNV